jgi:hypothetical protein
MNVRHAIWMWVCCALMILGAFALLSFREPGTPSGGVWLFLPVLLCLSMHLFMHRGHGNSHADHDHDQRNSRR